jgi:hypothetical protein
MRQAAAPALTAITSCGTPSVSPMTGELGEVRHNDGEWLRVQGHGLSGCCPDEIGLGQRGVITTHLLRGHDGCVASHDRRHLRCSANPFVKSTSRVREQGWYRPAQSQLQVDGLNVATRGVTDPGDMLIVEPHPGHGCGFVTRLWSPKAIGTALTLSPSRRRLTSRRSPRPTVCATRPIHR